MVMGVARAGLGDLVGGYLIGANPTDIERMHSLLKQAGSLGWRNFWIEAACWDILGKVTARPIDLDNLFLVEGSTRVKLEGRQHYVARLHSISRLSS
jgi:hypothetical protein